MQMLLSDAAKAQTDATQVRTLRVMRMLSLHALLVCALIGCRGLTQPETPWGDMVEPAAPPRAYVTEPVDTSARTVHIGRELDRWVDAVDLGSLATTATPDPGRFYFGGGLSLLPNVGITGHAGWAFARNSAAVWSLEAEGGWQFFDDESIIDDGRPAAGDWLQARLGVRVILSPDRPRRVVLRGGAAWFQARGEPNLVQREGNYFGAYVGVGFETSLSPTITVGPEITVMAAANSGGSEFGIVPQIGWRLSWWPGGHGFPVSSQVGELYADVHLSFLPSVGAGFGLGQVFLAGDDATWSVEALATFQWLSDDLLLAEGGGRLAQLRGGVKVVTSPSDPRHWTGRVGVVWMRNTGPVKPLPTEGDYVGGYVGVGYLFDLSRHVSTGPELTLFVVALEGSSGLELVPEFTWHFVYRF